MNRGADYWLVGKPTCDLVRCRDLGTMFSAETGIEDVLCVCLKQRLLACGTKDGRNGFNKFFLQIKKIIKVICFLKAKFFFTTYPIGSSHAMNKI